MNVDQVCTREVDTVTPNESVVTAAQRMLQRSVGSLVVVDRNLEVVGILTDRDLAMRVVAVGLSPTDTLVSQVMTKNPTTVFEGCSLEHALATMSNRKFRRLPVVDQCRRLVALITVDDAMMNLAESFSQVRHVLQSETPVAVASERQFGDPSRFHNESREFVRK